MKGTVKITRLNGDRCTIWSPVYAAKYGGRVGGSAGYAAEIKFPTTDHFRIWAKSIGMKRLCPSPITHTRLDFHSWLMLPEHGAGYEFSLEDDGTISMNIYNPAYPRTYDDYWMSWETVSMEGVDWSKKGRYSI